jgi:ADP-ribose pyrophosphatase YjhB (NUDIX family)
MTTTHGVTWIVIRDGHVLLERCPKKARHLGVGEWFVPGGKLENGEGAAEALIREIREEWPGVRIEEFEPLPLLEGSLVPPGPRGVFLMRPYLVRVSGEIPSHSDEGVELRWIPLRVALNSPVPQVRMMIAAACALAGALEDVPRYTASVGGCGDPECCGSYPVMDLDTAGEWMRQDEVVRT